MYYIYRQYVDLWKYLTEEKKKKAERDEVIAARKSAQEAAKKVRKSSLYSC